MRGFWVTFKIESEDRAETLMEKQVHFADLYDLNVAVGRLILCADQQEFAKQSRQERTDDEQISGYCDDRR